jgi:amino acid adenylation domain-containing protein
VGVVTLLTMQETTIFLDSLAESIASLASLPGKRVGVLSERSLASALLITQLVEAGLVYVPLDPAWPAPYLQHVLQDSGIEALYYAESARAVAAGIALPDQFVLPNLLASEYTFDQAQSQKRLATWRQAPQQPLCLLYTSGTTGLPKGMVITVDNEFTYIETLVQHFALQQQDRIAFAADLTFDMASTQLWLAWYTGATLVVCPERQNMAPVAWINREAISVWFSVPAVIDFSRRLGLLEQAMPSLRVSLFSGEALYYAAAAAWQQAAANSVVYNLYGPTETDVCTWHPFDVTEQSEGVMPIGTPLPHHVVVVVDVAGKVVESGEAGELWVSGRHVVSGYLNQAALSKARFTVLQGDPEPHRIWYHTGDWVQQDAIGVLHYRGRVDHQVKLQGKRVECQAIEKHLREISGYEALVLVEQGQLMAFVAVEGEAEVAQWRQQMQACLPQYMCPARYVCCTDWPLNRRGKVDRAALLEQMRQLL